MTEQTPCPFCGSTNLIDGSWYVDDEEVSAIECDDCKAGAPASVWDRRAEVTRLRAERAALVEALERISSFESEGILDDEDAEDMLDIAQRALAAAQEDSHD